MSDLKAVSVFDNEPGVHPTIGGRVRARCRLGAVIALGAIGASLIFHTLLGFELPIERAIPIFGGVYFGWAARAMYVA